MNRHSAPEPAREGDDATRDDRTPIGASDVLAWLFSSGAVVAAIVAGDATISIRTAAMLALFGAGIGSWLARPSRARANREPAPQAAQWSYRP